MADRITSIYEKACAKGILDPQTQSEQWFREQLSTEQGIKSFYEHATANGMKFHPYPEFKERLSQPMNPSVKENPAPTTEEENQESLRRQDAASGATSDPNQPFVAPQDDNQAYQEQMLRTSEAMRRNAERMAQRTQQAATSIPQPSLSLGPQDGSIGAALERMQRQRLPEIRKHTIANNMLNETAQSLGELQRADREKWMAQGEGMTPTQRSYLEQAYTEDPYLSAANSVLYNAEVRMQDAKRQNGISWKNIGEGLASFGKDTGRHLLTKLEGMASFGMSDLRNAKYQRDVLKKVADANAFDNPDAVLTPQEKALYDATVTNIAVEIARQNDTSRWSKAGQITADMIPFIEDIMLGNALFRGFGDAGRKAITKGVEKHVKNKLAKWLLTNVGDVAMSAGESAATAAILPHTYANMYGNMTQADMDKVGMDGYRMTLGGLKEQGAAQAWGNAYRDQVKEIFTETGGNFRLIGRALIDNPLGKKILKTPFGMVLKRFEGAQGGAGSRFASMTMYHGVLGEWLEELEAAIYDGNLKEFFTADTQLPMLLSFSVPAAFTGGLNAGQHAYLDAKYKSAGKTIDKLIDASAYVGPDKNTLKGQIMATLYQTPTENLPQAIGMCVEQVYPQEYKALMEGAPEKGNKAAELAYALKEYLASGTVLTAFDPDMLGGQIADVQAHREQMRQQATEAAQAAVQGITHEDGNIYRVGIKGKDDEAGYAFRGNLNIEPDNDGTLATRGRDLITIKMDDGTTLQVPADELTIIEAPQSAQERIDQMTEHYFAQYANEDLFHVGDKVYLKQNGQQSEESSTIVGIIDEGIEVEIIGPDGQQDTTIIPHEQAAEALAVAEGETEDNIVTYVLPDNTQLRLRKTGDGVYERVYEDGMPGLLYTEYDLAEMGAQPLVQEEAPANTGDQGMQTPVVAQPAYPMDETGNPAWGQMEVPQSAQVLYDLYQGNRESAKAYADDQLKEAQKVQKAAAKQASHNLNLAQRLAEEEQNAQFKAQADAAVKYWEDVKLAIAQIKTAEELAAEQAQRDAIMAAREQRSKTEEGTTANATMAERYNAAPKIIGNAGTTTLPDGRELAGHYVLIAPEGVTPSHDVTKNFQRSEGYPVTSNGQSINDRDYTSDQEEQQKVVSIAQNFNGNAIKNMPVISDDGLVYNGNGRMMAGQLAALNGTDAAYTQSLMNNAAQYGFTPEQVASIPNARVVFQLDERLPYSTQSLAIFNEQETQTQSNTGKAAGYARKLTPQAVSEVLAAVDGFNTIDAFFSDKKAPFNLINSLINAGIIAQREKAEMVDGDKLSATGRERLSNILFGTVFDNETIRLMGDDAALKNSILRALPQILDNKSLGEFSLESDINDAIRLLYEVRRAGAPFQSFVRQTVMSEDGEVHTAAENYSPYQLLLAEEMTYGGVDAFRDVLNLYNEQASTVQGGQVDIFGNLPTMTELKNLILQRYGKEPTEAERPSAGRQIDNAPASAPASNEPAAEQITLTDGRVVTPATIKREDFALLGDMTPIQRALIAIRANLAQHPKWGLSTAGFGNDARGLLFHELPDKKSDLKKVEDIYWKTQQEYVAEPNKTEEYRLAADDVLREIYRRLQYIDSDKYPVFQGSALISRLKDAELAVAEAETDTNPTEAQKKAENYKQGHVTLWGLPITIENPKGSIRRGTDANGKQWEQEMHHTYGKIRRTEGVDGDHIDVFIGPNLTSDKVFVVDQRNVDTGEFDEHKCMLGFDSIDEAQAAYLSNYEEGWRGMGPVTEVTMDKFKKWIDSSHRKTKPFAEYKSVKTEGAASTAMEEQPMPELSNEPLRKALAKVINGFELGERTGLSTGELEILEDEVRKLVKKHNAPTLQAALDAIDNSAAEQKARGVSWIDTEDEQENLFNVSMSIIGDLFRAEKPKRTRTKAQTPSAPTDNRETSETQATEQPKESRFEELNKLSTIEVTQLYQKAWKDNDRNTLRKLSDFAEYLITYDKNSNIILKGISYHNAKTFYEITYDGYWRQIFVYNDGSVSPQSWMKSDIEVLVHCLVDGFRSGKATFGQNGGLGSLTRLTEEDKEFFTEYNIMDKLHEQDQPTVEPNVTETQTEDLTPLEAAQKRKAEREAKKAEVPQTTNRATLNDQSGNLNEPVEQPQPAEQPKAEPKNTIFTDEAYEAAKKRMRARLNRLNMGLDPEMVADQIVIAGYHVERGARRFADFARALIADFGDGIRQYARQMYNYLRDIPEGEPFRAEMDDYATVMAFDIDNFDFKDRMMPAVREYEDVNGQKITVTDVSKGFDGTLHYDLNVTEPSGHVRQTTIPVDDFNKELESKDIFPANSKENAPESEKSSEKIWKSPKNFVTLHREKDKAEGNAKNWDWLEANIDRIVDDYKAKNGNVLDPDVAREYFNPIGYDGSNVPQYRTLEKALVDALYSEMLKEALAQGKTKLVLLTGHGGAGKSTATRNNQGVQATLNEAGVVFDAAMNSFTSLQTRLDQAKQYGVAESDITIIPVYNDAATSFENILSRTVQSNRVLSIKYFLDDAFRDNAGKIARVMDEYPQVTIIPINNEKNNGGRAETLEQAARWNYEVNDDIVNQILDIYERYINEGRLKANQVTAIGEGLSDLEGSRGGVLSSDTRSRARDILSQFENSLRGQVGEGENGNSSEEQRGVRGPLNTQAYKKGQKVKYKNKVDGKLYDATIDSINADGTYNLMTPSPVFGDIFMGNISEDRISPIEQPKEEKTAAREVGTISKSKHTKTGEDIYVVSVLGPRLSDDEFKVLKARARANNGYYSSFAKNRGFIFHDYEDAKRFNNISDEELTTNEVLADTETAIKQAETVAASAAAIGQDGEDRSGAEREQRTEDAPASVGAVGTVSEHQAEPELSPEEADAAVTECKEAISNIDETVEHINEQLAVLGYYQADETKDFHEYYGYMKSAEKLVVADADKLGKQLATDLGIEVNKRKKVASANLSQIGGDVKISLPLPEGRELNIWISVRPNAQVTAADGHRDDGTTDSLVVQSIMWRVDHQTGYGSNNWEWKEVTYQQLLKNIRRIAKNYLPEVKPEQVDVPELPANPTMMDVVEQATARKEAIAKKRSKNSVQDGQQVLDLFADAVDEINDGIAQENSTPAIDEQTEPINNKDNGSTEVRNDGERKGSAPQRRTAGQPADQNGTLGGGQRQANEGTQSGGVGSSSEQHRVHDGERGLGTTGQRSTESVEEPVVEGERKNTHNFRYDPSDPAPTSNKARYEANLAAIRLLKQLQDEDRQATPEEQRILAKFTGWGGLGEFFKGEPGTTYWSDHGEKSPYQVIKELLTDEEMQAAQLSRNSAYFTPPAIIDELWNVAKHLGFKGGNILEGSAGIGNILSQMPQSISDRSNLQAVEIDTITAGILAQLYPDAQVHAAGFQEVDIPNNSQDLVITNVPFVTGLRVYDKKEKDLSKRFGNIHDFCIAKNVRKLRQGGIGIFITTSGTLDSSKDLRRWLNNEGETDVIAAFRLNRETFGGTSATSDIIVVRKRVNGQKDPRAIDVLDTDVARVAETEEDGKNVEKKLIYNRYFVEHPESMGGEMGFGFEHGDTRWGGTTAGCYPSPSINQSERLQKWVEAIPTTGDVQTVTVRESNNINPGTYEEYHGDLPYGSLVLNSKDEICRVYNGMVVPVEGINPTKVKGHTKAEVLTDYNALKAAVEELLAEQAKGISDEGLKGLLKKLNRAYDDFVKKYGNLNRNVSLSFLRNDVQWASMAALENVRETIDKNGKKQVEVSKTDVFSKRVVGVQAEPKAENARDGVILSVQQYGNVRPDMIAMWLERPQEDVEKEIIESRLAFRDPQTGNMVVSHEYLSGNVREKLAYAEEHNENGIYDTNIEELRKVIPVDIPAHLIEFNIGSTWIPVELYHKYLKEKFGVESLQLVHVGSAWISNEKSYGRYSLQNEKNRSEGVYSEILMEQVYGHQLMIAAMNNVPVVVSRTEKHRDGTTETITDKAATAACSDKISQIKDDFVEWARGKMQEDSELAERVQKIYNERFNAIVPMLSVDKAFLSPHLPGQNHKYTLYDHQQQAVVRATTQPVMLAHEVGTGKTITLISSAMEMRRLGTAKKPMIVVQNATTPQFVKEAKDLYPNAKILTVSERDRTKEGRQEFYAKIKYNDWDLIIVPQSVFDMIPDSESRMRDFIQEKIEEKLHAIEAAKEANVDEKVTKRMERELEALQEDLQNANMSGKRSKSKTDKDAKKEAERIENAKARAEEMLDRRTDEVEDFDDMGIDALLIDEAHNYKHMGFATMMTRGVKGIDPSYSKRAAALYLKCQSVYERCGHRNVVFATGTPISNTAAEIWTFMKYLMPKEVLKDNDIYYFDDFVHNFGKINEQLEFATNGKFKANNRFAQYGNVPELMRIWLTCADCVLTREVGQVNDKVPELEGGKAQDIFLPQSPSLIDIMASVRAELERYEQMSGKEKKENSHIPLTMYGVAKRAAIDPRLVDANAADEPLSKTNKAVEETLRSLKETKKYNGTVAIFCDSYRNLQTGFNLFEDIKAKLVKAGVPAAKIAIIRSEMTDAAKQKIFDAVREGEIRVIMGSTQTLGTGVNIQTRLHTLIHMDAPDRPMDYTQRNGRIIRQGNMHRQWNLPVRVLRFGVEDSLDVTSYQRLKTKAGFIDSIMNGKSMIDNNLENRVLEDVEEGIFDNPVAMLSGSQYALLKSQAERDLRKWQARKQQHDIDQILIAKKLKDNAKIIEHRRQLIATDEQFLQTLKETFPTGKVTEYNIDGTICHNAAELKEALKAINAEIQARADKLRKEGYEGSRQNIAVSLQFNGMPFNVNIVLIYNSRWESGQRAITINKEVQYTTPTSDHWLGSPTKVLDKLVEHIEQDYLSGTQATGEINYSRSYIERLQQENELMRQREGKPFEHGAELEKAQALVDEYTEKMQEELAEKEAKYANQSSGRAVTLNEQDDEEETPEAQITSLDYPQFSNQTEAQQLATAALVEVLNDNTDLDVFLATDEEASQIMGDDNVEFSIRKEPAPKKTGIGYKVFYRGKDGKLYPPMVANPNGEATPVGVWLNADAAPVAGESKTGRPQVKAGGKGTQGGSGQLAYRPGWHLGEIPYALQFNRKDENGEKTLFPKDFVWAEVEYAADNDYQEEAMREGVNTSGKFQHSLAGLKHVPTDGFYRYRTNPNPATDPWIITGVMKVNRVLTNEEVDEIVRAAGREPQVREAMLTPNGTLYGWAIGDRIYLTKDGLNPNSPIHEYSHIWAKAMMRNNREGWQSIVDIFKGTPFWDEVVNDPNYQGLTTDDAICSEVLARYSGQRGAARMEEWAEEELHEAEQSGSLLRGAKVRQLISRAKKALADFWHWVGVNLFGIKHFDSAEQVADRVLWDMLNQTELGDVSNRYSQVATDAWNKYQYDGELESVRDVADYIEENMPKDATTQPLFDALDKYRSEEEEDRMLYGERGDLEPFEDVIFAEIKKLMKSTDNTAEAMISGYTQEKQRTINEWYAAHPRPQYQVGEKLEHYQARLEQWNKEYKQFRASMEGAKSAPIGESTPTPGGKDTQTPTGNGIQPHGAAPAFVPGVRPTPMPDETPGEYALRLRQYYQLMRDERLVAEYVAEINNQADAAAKVLKKNTIVRGLLDAAKPIENFQEWMKQRGATITDESNAYTDTFLATGRVTEANEQMQRDIIRPLAKQIAKIIAPDAKTGKSRLDGINIVWHNMDVAGTGSKLDGKALTPREIIGVYCQAKDCAEAIEKGLPDRGAKGFLNNLGMSHDDIIAAVESVIPRAELDELWRLINAATHFALNYDYESGRISEDTHTEFYQREFYVPQRGWRERDESGLITDYEPVGKRGNDPYNAALVKAHGRQSLASDPFAYIMSIDASSIVSSENNKIKQKFLRFCLDNEDLGLQTGAFRVKKYWIMNVIDPETGKIKLDEEGNPMMEVSYVAPTAEDLSHDRTIKELIKKKRKEWAKVNQAYLERQSHGELGPQLEAAYKTKLSKIEQAIEDLEQQMHIAWHATNTNITQRTSDEKRQHEVRVLLDGQEYLIEVQDEKLANAINKKFKQHQEQLFNTSQKMRNATRFMSAVLTQYNPEFAASNFARDFQVALATLTAEHPELVGSFLKNFAACQPAVWQYAFNDKVRDRAVFRDSELGRYLQEYFKAGAATGFSYMQDLKSLRQDFDAMVNESNLRRGIKGAVGVFSTLTEVSETAVRFAGYVAARQKGMGINEAAYLSKELTTNFDRAGEVADSGWMSWFSFFRATLNGNIKFLKALKKMPLAYSLIAAAYVAMGMLNQFLNPDDPEDEVWAGDFTRESNFVIGKWRIPTAHFLRMFFAAGVNAAKWMQGEKSFGEATYNTANFASQELLPNYLNLLGNGTEWNSREGKVDFTWEGLLQGVMPSPISPIADVYFNRDFRGATINREPFAKSQEGTKDILLSKENTLPVYKWLTQAIYEGVGGNMNAKYQSDDPAWRSWLFDTSASSVEHVVEGYMPAGMDMFITLGEAIYDAATGTPTGPDKWPFVRKFYNAYTPERAYMQQYYLLNGRVKEFKRNMDDYRKNDRTKYNILTHSQEYRNYQEAERLVKNQKENPTTADVQALINANKQWIK